MGESNNQATKLCRACKEPIKVDATICHHCQTVQKRSLWYPIGNTLKWLGGVTAVFSLLFTLVSANQFLADWRQRQTAINELVTAANEQREIGEYQRAWNSYKEVLTIDPTHSAAGKEQLNLALIWMRTKIRALDIEATREFVEQLIPVLYKGLATPNKQEKATIYAHLSWGEYLNQGSVGWDIVARGQPKKIIHFVDKALNIDPHNNYALAFKAHYMARRFYGDNIDYVQVDSIFTDVLNRTMNKSYMREIQFYTYTPHHANSSGAVSNRTEYIPLNALAISTFASLLDKNQTLTDLQKQFMYLIFQYRVVNNTLFEMVDKSDKHHVEVVLRYLTENSWLDEDSTDSAKLEEDIFQDILKAVLYELQGDSQQARKIYNTLLQPHESDRVEYQRSRKRKVVEKGLARLNNA